MKNNALWELAKGHGWKNRLFFCFILVVNTFSALFEGLSFSCFLFSLSFEHKLPFSFSLIENLDQTSHFIFFVCAAIVLQVIRSVTGFIGQVMMNFLATKLQMQAQEKIYNHIFKASFRSISRYKVGDLVDYASLPGKVVLVLMEALNRVMVCILMLLALFVLMLFLSPLMTLILFVLSSLVIYSQKVLLKKVVQFSNEQTEEMVELSKETVQSIYGLKAIYTFDRRQDVLHKIGQTLLKMAQKTIRLNNWNHVVPPLNEITGILLIGICLIVGSVIFKEGHFPLLSSLLTFVTVAYRMSSRLQMMMAYAGVIASHKGSLERLNEILISEDKEFAVDGVQSFNGLQHKIEFKDVQLDYGTQALLALDKLTFSIVKGEVIALVGASGAGKSSVIDLLLGLYEPSSGHILIDGIELSTLNLGSWRKRLGVVSQDTLIFNETIAENICFGAHLSEEKIRQAAILSGAHVFIEKLEKGYQTVVGERGYKLSGGEKQRLALARALVRDPHILILDEATSNLDSHSESLIQEALEHFRKDRTLIIVAHRLSTIMSADQILVLEEGRLIEQGTHETLLKLKGRYYTYWSIQSKGRLKKQIQQKISLLQPLV